MIVVSNTSPLTNLAAIGQFDLEILGEGPFDFLNLAVVNVPESIVIYSSRIEFQDE